MKWSIMLTTRTLFKGFSQDVANFALTLKHNPAYGSFAAYKLNIQQSMNCVDRCGNNPLHIALITLHDGKLNKGALKVLLNKEFYPEFDDKNKSNKTPFDIIRENIPIQDFVREFLSKEDFEFLLGYALDVHEIE